MSLLAVDADEAAGDQGLARYRFALPCAAHSRAAATVKGNDKVTAVTGRPG
jgi:hypothetical protein